MNETPLSDEQLNLVCKIGQGDNCCSYIACLPPFEFVCAKQMPDIFLAIERRRAEGTMSAKGDNCSGPPNYIARIENAV